MLDDQVPLAVIHLVIKICYCDLGSPVFLVVELDMPMNSNRAHMRSALDDRCRTGFVQSINGRSKVR